MLGYLILGGYSGLVGGILYLSISVNFHETSIKDALMIL